jgi:S-adenosylmethionine hydrolase
MIALFTDYGVAGPYVGQMHAVFAQQAPSVPVIDLFHDVPAYHVRAGAYLLPAYTGNFPPQTIFVCVVDPGVGGARRAVVVEADDRWYLGPDNGLLTVVAQRAHRLRCHEILWRAPNLSNTFHGRDLFAPVAALLAGGRMPESRELPFPFPDPLWPDDLAEAVYVDNFGNVLTGLRATTIPQSTRLRAGDVELGYAPTFSAVPVGQCFWYENSNGLVEIAKNQGRADVELGLGTGATIGVL